MAREQYESDASRIVFHHITTGVDTIVTADMDVSFGSIAV
jgi:hypothetical protein